MLQLIQFRQHRCLIACLVWLAGCGAIWWALPFVPRLIVPAPGGYHEFTADSRFVGGQDYTPDDRARIAAGGSVNAETDIPNGPFSLRNVADGTSIRVFESRNYSTVEFAPDGREILVEENRIDVGRKHFLVDVATGQPYDLPVDVDGSIGRAQFTLDGRFVVYERHGRDGSDLVWMERTGKMIVGTVPDAEIDIISNSGRWIKSKVPVLQVREAATDRVLFDLSNLGNASADRFLPNDDFLLIEKGKWKKIVDSSNPVVMISLPSDYEFIMMSDFETLFVSESVIGGTRLTQWNLRTGVITGIQEYRNLLNRDHGTPWWVTPIRTRMLFQSQLCTLPFLDRVMARIPGLRNYARGAVMEYVVLNVVTGSVDARIPFQFSARARLSPDGQTLLIDRANGFFEFWDLPPGKSWTWFFLAASGWSSLVLGFVWQRFLSPRRLIAQ